MCQWLASVVLWSLTICPHCQTTLLGWKDMSPPPSSVPVDGLHKQQHLTILCRLLIIHLFKICKISNFKFWHFCCLSLICSYIHFFQSSCLFFISFIGERIIILVENLSECWSCMHIIKYNFLRSSMIVFSTIHRPWNFPSTSVNLLEDSI